jgi:hypothetical protein
LRPIFVLLLLIATSDAAAEDRSSIVTGEQIILLERSRQEAFVRGDVAFLDAQTSADYTTVNGAGVMSTKPEMMRSLRAGTTKVKSFELAELEAHIHGPVAVLTGIYRDESSVKGLARRVNVRFTRVFLDENGKWRAIAYQQTPLRTR